MDRERTALMAKARLKRQRRDARRPKKAKSGLGRKMLGLAQEAVSQVSALAKKTMGTTDRS